MIQPSTGSFGEKKKLCTMSPMPDSLEIPAAGESAWIKGTMVRVIRFQSALSSKGITGWTLSVKRSASLDPIP